LIVRTSTIIAVASIAFDLVRFAGRPIGSSAGNQQQTNASRATAPVVVPAQLAWSG
jgi:hypothetical protein